MAAPTLTKKARLTILACLCEGCCDAAIIERLQTEHGLTCTPQNLEHYRKKWVAEVDEAEAQALDVAKRSGWGRKTKRVAFICSQLDNIETQQGQSNAAQFVDLGLGKEYRELVADLRKELGQESPTKIDMTHAGEVLVASVQMNELVQDKDGIDLLARIASRLCPRNGDAAHAGDEAD